jgi:uncharacterized protein YqeY
LRFPLALPARYNSDMITRELFESDLKDAMRSGDQVKKRTLRMLLTSAKLAEVAAKKTLLEPELLGLIAKEIKSRQESIEEAQQYQRQDLVDSNQAEIEVLQAYLPPALATDELTELIKSIIEQTGATSQADMGKVMKELMPRLQGRADGKVASNIVRDLLVS